MRRPAKRFKFLQNKAMRAIPYVIDPLARTVGGSHANVIKGWASDAGSWRPTTRVHVGLTDDALRDALRRHAFLLSTSSYEGYGIPIVEAMAALVLCDHALRQRAIADFGERGKPKS